MKLYKKPVSSLCGIHPTTVAYLVNRANLLWSKATCKFYEDATLHRGASCIDRNLSGSVFERSLNRFFNRLGYFLMQFLGPKRLMQKIIEALLQQVISCILHKRSSE